MIMTKEELSTIIENHQHWLHRDCEGWERMKANLSGVNLVEANLRYVDLSYADFKDADLRYASLDYISLIGADLTNANLRGASLIHTDLESANLTDAFLEDANLVLANLRHTNLKGASLSGANLARANLIYANLENIIGDYANFPYREEGLGSRNGEILTTDIIGYKKCLIDYRGCSPTIIVKLLIPRGAIVFSINDKKCRTNKAKVLEIEGVNRAYSWHSGMSYYVGDEITVYNFNCRYNIECAEGIHFFKNKEDAINF